MNYDYNANAEAITNSNSTSAARALNFIGAACMAALVLMSAAKAISKPTETAESTTTAITGELETIGGSPRVEHIQTEYVVNVVKDVNDKISSYEKLDQPLVKFEFDEEYEDDGYEEYSVIE